MRIWREAQGWLSPGTDYDIVVRLCEAEDMRAAMSAALAETGLLVAGSMGQQRPNPLIDKLQSLSSSIVTMERECGLTASSRGSMRVGEVSQKPASPVDEILAAHAARRSARR